MKKNPLIAVMLGLALLAAGAVLHFAGGPPGADAALAQRCRAEMAARGADAAMTDKCGEAAFASAVTATDAQTAAQSIGAANSSEVGGNALAMFLIGIGLVLTIGGIFRLRQNRRA